MEGKLGPSGSHGKRDFKIGQSVQIKRTDGRVHGAVIAAVNYDQRTASVEWMENKECKGKDIDLSILQRLNPDLNIFNDNDNNHINEKKPADAPLEVDLTRDEFDDSDMESYVPCDSESDNNNDQDHNGNNNEAPVPVGNDPPDSSSTDLNNIMLPENQEKVASPLIVEVCRSQNDAHPSLNHFVQESETKEHVGLVRSSIYSRTVQPQYEDNNAPPPVSRITSNPRVSGVVKRVEEIKANRNERRQRQAEERETMLLHQTAGGQHRDFARMIADYRRGIDIHPLGLNDDVEEHLITVCLRKRPMNKKELSRKEVDVITIPTKNQVIVHEPRNKVDLTKYLENQMFRFDYVFNETCTNETVYRYTAQPLISTVFEGGFATCFAYGQTGSGKTHTMGGDFHGKTQHCDKGIYALATEDIFRLAASPKYKPLKIVVSASFFEIYSGKVFDLLNGKAKLRVLEDCKQQVQVVGLTEKVVSSTADVIKLLQKGNAIRTSGQTSANVNSSRSHAVFQLYLREPGRSLNIHGKFSLIDLAGNERGADTSSSNRQTRMEGAEINKSLLALKECIRALGRKGGHLPFRVSKLTQVLRDSFVGTNSRTCMIAMVSPSIQSCEHTLNTLRYADRVKELGAGDLQPTTNSEITIAEDDGDLAQLQSLNANDMPAELLNFHHCISELQVLEEQMLDNQKQLLDVLLQQARKGETLLKTADTYDYDQEAYCTQWTEFINDTIQYLHNCGDLVTNFKQKLVDEEQLSRKTKKRIK